MASPPPGPIIEIVSRSQFKDLCQSLETAPDAESLPRAIQVYTIGDGDLASTLSEAVIFRRVLSSLNSIAAAGTRRIPNFSFSLQTIEVDPERVGDMTRDLVRNLESNREARRFITRMFEILSAKGCTAPEEGNRTIIELVGTEGLGIRLLSTSLADVLATLSNMHQIGIQCVELTHSGTISAENQSDIQSNCSSLVFSGTWVEGRDADITLPHEILSNLQSIAVEMDDSSGENQWMKRDQFFAGLMNIPSLKKIVVRDYRTSSRSLISLAKAIAAHPNIPQINEIETDNRSHEVIETEFVRDMDMLLNAVVAKQLSLKKLTLNVPCLGFTLPKGLSTEQLYLSTKGERPIIESHFFEEIAHPKALVIQGALISREVAKVLSNVPLERLSLNTRSYRTDQTPPTPLKADVVTELLHSKSALSKSLKCLRLDFDDFPEPAIACLAASMTHLCSLKELEFYPSFRRRGAQIPQLIHVLKQSKTITKLKSCYGYNVGQRYDAILDAIVNSNPNRPNPLPTLQVLQSLFSSTRIYPGIENATFEQKRLAKYYSLQIDHILRLNASGAHKLLQRLERSGGISPTFLLTILNRIDQGYPCEALYFLLRKRPTIFASAYQGSHGQS